MNRVFLFLALAISSSFAMNYTDVKCHKYASPTNGKLVCQKDVTASLNCHVQCNDGYDVEYLQAENYKCTPEGKWEVEPDLMTMPWPNCVVYGPGMPIP
ncbi:sushi, von Willebrand factor type A, EGF and pentraxin domain-containing protein 1-like [Dendronephthya gigantea]|uniref:sushi, von Willebrand factor type A, EGF and pentraxin domain-containing protein 1-like n=1 Tax=Dendronephthya gigantea TaxID=151771 RepID=UPI00106D0268|nr:sushi, von Willebrand factor type A, EGF and pentraxin domain-containing protein 1-like [Dendronephthya gigantea]